MQNYLKFNLRVTLLKSFNMFFFVLFSILSKGSTVRAVSIRKEERIEMRENLKIKRYEHVPNLA